jgi:hypothetical protein
MGKSSTTEISWEGEYSKGDIPCLNSIPWNSPITVIFAPSECSRRLLLETVLAIMVNEGFDWSDAIGLIRQAIGSRISQPDLQIDSMASVMADESVAVTDAPHEA